MEKIRGNKVLSGTWAEVWVDGDKILECSKIEQKVIINREDVQIDLSVDSKPTGMKGEFTIEVKKVFTRYNDALEQLKKGHDPRFQIIAKLEDPDAVGGQIERYSTDNCWFNELPIINYEKGGIITETLTGGFTPQDMQPLDQIV